MLDEVIMEAEYNVLMSLYNYYEKQLIMESFIMEDDKPEVHVDRSNNNQQSNGNQNLIQRFVAWCQNAIKWIKNKLSKSTPQQNQQSIANKPDFTRLKSLVSDISSGAIGYSDAVKQNQSNLQAEVDKLIAASEKTSGEFKAQCISFVTYIESELKQIENNNNAADAKLYTSITKELTGYLSNIDNTNNTNDTNNTNNTDVNNKNKLDAECMEIVNNTKCHTIGPDKTDIYTYIGRLGNFKEVRKFVVPLLQDLEKKIQWVDNFKTDNPKALQYLKERRAWLIQNFNDLSEAANEKRTNNDTDPPLQTKSKG